MMRARPFAMCALLLATACGGSGLPAATPSTIHAAVDHVVDGDTAWFRLAEGSREKVRFIGVDTPESTALHEPFGAEASAYTRSILTAGREIDLQLDADERDRYGRLLAYVWLTPPDRGDAAEARSRMLNAMLVAEGYANVLTVPPNVTYAGLFVRLQAEARLNGRGLWALGP